MNFVAEAVQGRSEEIVSAVIEREFERHPELRQRYGPLGREKALQDARYHLSFLAQALAANDAAGFRDYVAWAKVVLNQRNVRAEDLAFHLTLLCDVLREKLPHEAGEVAAEMVMSAVGAISEMAEDLPTLLVDHAPLSELAREFSAVLLRGDRATASTLVLDAVAAGTPVRDVYLHIFQTSQYEIGRLWQTNRISVAQEHYCTAATQLVMAQLYGQVFSSVKTGRTMVATSVAGNLHELGVRMVADFFEMEGWDSYYLGADTPHSAVVASLIEREAVLLAVSATLPTQVDAVGKLIAAVRDEPACKGVQVLVGGHPFNRDASLWRAVGADGSAISASAAVSVAVELLASTA